MNKEKYDELCKLVDDKNIDLWSRMSEQIFQKSQEIELKTEDDLLKLVAFAYSWMPTIPEWKKLNWTECKKSLEKLKNGENGALKEALEHIVPSINNSIVGASKVLYFAYPDSAPIIDSNVVIGWRKLFYPNGVRGMADEEIAALPSDFGTYGMDEAKRSRHIDLYVKYAANLTAWAKTLDNISIRNIETKLYLLGKL